MNSVKFIYFDIGNTLIDCSKAFETATIKFNLLKDDIGSVFDENHDEVTKGIISAQELWQKCIDKYNLKNANNYDFLNSWISDYAPIRPTHDLLCKLKTRYKVGLLSNIYKDMYPILIERGLLPNIKYDAVILSCDVGMMKQDKQIYELAQKKAGSDFDNIFFVDDRKDFLETAKKLGGQTFYFDFMQVGSSISELEKYLLI